MNTDRFLAASVEIMLSFILDKRVFVGLGGSVMVVDVLLVLFTLRLPQSYGRDRHNSPFVFFRFNGRNWVLVLKVNPKPFG